jgi:hypothetical protein
MEKHEKHSIRYVFYSVAVAMTPCLRGSGRHEKQFKTPAKPVQNACKTPHFSSIFIDFSFKNPSFLFKTPAKSIRNGGQNHRFFIKNG